MSTMIRTVDVQLKDLRVGGAAEPPPRITLRARLSLAARRNALFMVMVVLPTLLATLHYGLLAADIYVSVVKYVVRTPTVSTPSLAIGAALPGGNNISRSADDTHMINAYMESRDAVLMLRRQADVDQVYKAPAGDLISGFPRPFGNTTAESLFNYYRGMVGVKHDTNSGITTLSVSAFRPTDAQAVALKLMEGGEALANRLTVRMRRDLVERAEQETALARERVIAAQENITRWRNRAQMIDPTRYSAAIIEVIARLSLEAAQLRAQLAELQKASAQSPAIPPLQNRITALQQQIETERRALAGGTGSLAPQIVEFELLLLEKTLSEQYYTATVRSLEVARTDAQRQQIYLERIAEPQVPDYPDRPWRLFSILMVAVISFMFYVIVSKIAMNIARHGAFAQYFAGAQKHG
jgi:capsular polysaccharide transport system permease protein